MKKRQRAGLVLMIWALFPYINVLTNHVDIVAGPYVTLVSAVIMATGAAMCMAD